MRDSVAYYFGLQAEGLLMPFTVRLRDTGRVIGQTTYCNIEADHRRLEIGGTWNARSVHRSGTNTES
jgi:N-acetyltransferase